MPKLIDGSKFTTDGVTPGAGATTLYTVPAHHAAVVRHLSISNNNAAAKKITAQFYESSAAVYYFLAQDQLNYRSHWLVIQKDILQEKKYLLQVTQSQSFLGQK